MIVVLLIFGTFIAVGIAGLVYLYCRIQLFFPKEMGKWKTRGLALLPIVGLGIYCVVDYVNGVIVTVNILGIWLLCDLLFFLGKKFSRGGGLRKNVYWAGICAVVCTALYLGSGWYYAHHVVRTEYTLTTDKGLGKDTLRLVQIADSHLGATFDGDTFATYVERMEKEKPDIVVITGDFVDDDSKRADLERACEALGKMKTTYGVFYVYGNHDKGYFNKRDFNDADMRAVFARNGLTMLEDQVVTLGGCVDLIGRKDRSADVRAEMSELAKQTDSNHYRIVLDHQPHDFAKQAECGVDLVLCGHTHGGQMFPVGITGEISGANEKTYGMERRGNTNFIVTSGISDWAIDYKTGGAISEYVVIDVIME